MMVVFYSTLELAMSDSKAMPQGHKSSKARIKEFALTLSCNKINKISSLDPSLIMGTDQRKVGLSEETAKGLCDTIEFLRTYTTFID